MAEIEIERRPRRSGWTWLALLLVLVGVAVGAWLVFGNGVQGGDAAPAAETGVEAPYEVREPPPPPEPAGGVDETGADVPEGTMVPGTTGSPSGTEPPGGR